MKKLLRITLVLAVIVIGAVAFKAGYHEYTWRNIELAQTGVFTAPPTTLPPPTTETTTQIPADTEVVPPEKYIIETVENSTGTPMGSTVEKPNFENSVFFICCCNCLVT